MIETRRLKNAALFFPNNFKFCAVEKNYFLTLWLLKTSIFESFRTLIVINISVLNFSKSWISEMEAVISQNLAASNKPIATSINYFHFLYLPFVVTEEKDIFCSWITMLISIREISFMPLVRFNTCLWAFFIKRAEIVSIVYNKFMTFFRRDTVKPA